MISVCMATYNGARYIREQVNSILEQLGVGDELVVCDDSSSDQTLRILADFRDERIKIYKNPDQLGHVRNFERALTLARGDYIFLSDQDDVWIPGRVRLMIDAMNSSPGNLLVASNFDLIDERGDDVGRFGKLGKVKQFRWLQIASIFAGKSPYYGCTFLLRREALRYFLPIPKGVESHDIWFGLAASMLGGVVNMPDSTLKHRLHDRNVTTKRRRALMVVLKSRFVFARALALRMPFFVGFKR